MNAASPATLQTALPTGGSGLALRDHSDRRITHARPKPKLNIPPGHEVVAIYLNADGTFRVITRAIASVGLHKAA